MDDAELIARIGELVDEEHRLDRQLAASGPDPEARERLAGLEVALDRCWDLLRQRRARRAAGADPDDAELRPGRTVEGYQQ